MAFDATTGALMLFGGMEPGTAANRLNDTWLLVGTTWIEMTPATSPAARSVFAMTARSAPHNDIVMFGGRATTNAILHDTWRWDGGASEWVEITPIDGTQPVTWGGGTDAVYDSVRQVVTAINGHGTGVAPSITGPGSWTSEYDCVTNKWRAYGSDLTNQNANDPLLGRQRRFAIAFLNGKTYLWGGQDPQTPGTANMSFVKEYQATPLATASSYGAGCNGASGNPLTLTSDNDPWTCRTWSGTCSNLGATTLALQVFGWNTLSTQLSVVLPGIGQTGCVLSNTADSILGPVLPTAGSAPVSVTLPNNPVLAGQELHVQVAEVDLMPMRIWTSNGLTLTIGAL